MNQTTTIPDFAFVCCGKEIKAETTQLKNGRKAHRGRCPKCGQKHFKIFDPKIRAKNP